MLIYVDTCVCLGWLLGEGRQPKPEFWSQALASSRLLEYELWNRLHRERADPDACAGARQLLAAITLVEMSPLVLERAREPWPIAIRTLDALHLATALFLRTQLDTGIQMATYDQRLREAAETAGLASYPF